MGRIRSWKAALDSAKEERERKERADMFTSEEKQENSCRDPEKQTEAARERGRRGGRMKKE